MIPKADMNNRILKKEKIIVIQIVGQRGSELKKDQNLHIQRERLSFRQIRYIRGIFSNFRYKETLLPTSMLKLCSWPKSWLICPLKLNKKIWRQGL